MKCVLDVDFNTSFSIEHIFGFILPNTRIKLLLRLDECKNVLNFVGELSSKVSVNHLQMCH